MKICFISFSYYPNLDGVQNVTTYQAEGLAKLGHTVTVLTAKIQQTPETEVHNDVNIIRLPARKKWGLWTAGNKDKCQKTFLEVCSKQDVIIDVCYCDFLSRWFVPLMNKIKCKKICMLHGIWEFPYSKLDKTGIKPLLLKTGKNLRWKIWFKRNEKNFHLFDAVMHLHKQDFSVKYAKSIGYNKNHILVNAVDTVFFSEHKSPKNTEKFVFIQVANYSYLKNQICAMQAFYNAELQNAELWMIGSRQNDYYKYLVEQNEILKKDKKSEVKLFLGLSRAETVEKIKQADVTVLSSFSEHLPITILEGLASGLPYISTDVGVVSSIPGGIVCHTENEISNAMKKLYEDKVLRKKLTADGRQYALENCQVDVQVKKLEDIINGL
jgi:glycosyltransferase involved in cell wall biosynthesis